MATSYIHTLWKSAPADSPVELFSELDPARFETRKIEIFRDGRVGFASAATATLDTRLAIEPLPTVAEIQSEGEFEAKSISKDEFEAKWKAVGAK